MSSTTIFTLALVALAICMVSSRSINLHETGVDSQIQLSHNRQVITKNFKCPAIYGRYPHPQSCEYFFECRFGQANLQQCDRNYLYDEKKEKCVDKKKVDCRRGRKDGSGSSESESSEEKDDSEEFSCPYIWGSFPDPRDCSKYYVCLYDVPTPYKCHKSELFDEKASECLQKNKVNCGKRKDKDEKDDSKTSKSPKTTTTKKMATTTSAVPTTKVSDRFYCPSSNGRYADPNDCSRYYECRSAVATLKQCQRSQLYDEKKAKCREKQDVRCGNRGEDSKEEKLDCPYEWGTFVHPRDCSKYIVCVKSVPTVRNCNKENLFHRSSRRCLPKKKVNCDNRINPDDLLPTEKTTKSTITPIFSTITTTDATAITTAENVPTTTVTEETAEATTLTERTATAEETTETEQPATAEETTATEQTATGDETSTSKKKATAEETTATEKTATTEENIETEKTATAQETTSTEQTATAEETTATEQTATADETTATEITTTAEEISTTTLRPNLPNTPPPTDCNEDDIDCIINGTGDVTKWFACPDRYGHYPHGSSKKLFIHCDNFKPYIKTCANNTEFSPEYLVCIWS